MVKSIINKMKDIESTLIDQTSNSKMVLSLLDLFARMSPALFFNIRYLQVSMTAYSNIIRAWRKHWLYMG